MHTTSSLINQLAELVGFHKNYTNYFGDQVSPKDEALHALLNAMGYNLTCEQKLLNQVSTLKDKEWLNILPEAHIAKSEEQDHVMTISLQDEPSDELSWKITTEANNTSTQRIALSSLTAIAQITIGTNSFTKYTLQLPTLDDGYHEIEISYGTQKSTCHLIFAPKTCFSPEEANNNKMWGFAAQLYSLRSSNNWGLGDFGDLKNLVGNAAKEGASAIGLNPLHPLYQNNPGHISPYSPTSRCFLNTLYIDVTSAPNFNSCDVAQARFNSEEFQSKLEFARSVELIDYPAVADIKFELLEILFKDFISDTSNTPLSVKSEFSAFIREQGDDLLKLTTFDALYEHFRRLDENAFGWKAWPLAYQKPETDEVIEFQKTHADRIHYFAFLQWLAHRQLTDAASTANDNEMPIGLYLDLAVGCDGSGVDVWSDKEMYVSGASVGAPPDAMNTLGQDWGLTPINPVALQTQGYFPLVKALRSNMQYAGALRIDHILGLMRQYWVAPGMAAHEGVYITFPLPEILRIIALESRRERCIVIGEDLGTIPDGFGDIMEAAGLLSYKVLFFERWNSGLFKRPEEYPAQSMVTISTHDLPTLAGWWKGRDLEWREQLSLYPTDELGQQDRDGRIADRNFLIAALTDLHVLAPENAPEQLPAQMNTHLSVAVQAYMAETPSSLQLIPLEDALELREQVNIPGTVDEHPNWRQKLPVTIEEFWSEPSVDALNHTMRQTRPK